MSQLTDLILTAGPSITNKEISYVTDAAAYGWNNQWANYLIKFQKEFAHYLHVKNALATSSCTGALHLILKALNVTEGDEVIIPELTWIATAAAVTYVGANPVFCDVDRESWTMDPQAVEKLITPRTKALLLVHLYGHPCDMEPLWALAKKHNLYLIEDAAQSIGATYQGKKTGSLGDAAAFSFQGAKAIVTGEGGMLVTDSDELLARAYYFGDHGRDANIPLFNTSIGYKYKMSNLQAALGLAQTQRIDEIVAKKQQIFKWYADRLQSIPSLTLNAQKAGCTNIYWMTSIILDKNIPFTRNDFMQKLKEYQIDSRPIFHPLSSMPMFTQANNPNAYYVGLRGINLPSGHNLTEEEVDYTCQAINKIINNDNRAILAKKGWMKYQEKVRNRIIELKKDLSFTIPIQYNQLNIGSLKAIGYQDINSMESVEWLCKWRAENQQYFPSQFKVTLESTKTWLEQQLVYNQDRILFFILDKENKPIGHIGLNQFDYKACSVELDNMILGDKSANPFIMVQAHKLFIEWSFDYFILKQMYLRVFSDNEAAIRLNQQNGFYEINRTPLIKRQEGEVISWDPLYIPLNTEVERYFVCMKYTKGGCKT